MTVVSIGTFARMTHVNVKRLRHYHDTGVLLPARVDDQTGYRYYDVRQADDARLVARLRGLDMPLPGIAAVIRAAEGDRPALLAAQLEELQTRLADRSEAVAAVRAMLEPVPDLTIDYREPPATTALTTRGLVTREQIFAWCGEAFGSLYGRLGDRLPAGPGAATYDEAFFTDDVGEVVALVPVTGGGDAVDVPGGVFAVAVHEGSFAEVSRTYAALGRHVALAGIGLPGPIRETYLVGPPAVHDPHRFRTEVAWPITRPVSPSTPDGQESPS